MEKDFLQKQKLLDIKIRDLYKKEKKTKIGSEKLNVIIFLIKNLALFDFFWAKFLGIQNKQGFAKETINSLNIYFCTILDSKKSLKLSLTDNSIKEDKQILLKYYKSNDYENKEIFNLILYKYQIIFYLSESFDPIKSLININDEKDNIEKALKCLNKLYNGKLNQLVILFSFLQEIHDKIEIIINKEQKFLLNTLIPENFNLKKYSNIYFCKLIDYTSRETKVLSIYKYIECFIYDIKKKIFH